MISVTQKTSRQPFQSIQAMRGLAAMSVAAHHTSLIMAESKYGGVSAFEAVTSKGWIGVNFFFVLSGFIIFLAHSKDINRPARLVSGF